MRVSCDPRDGIFPLGPAAAEALRWATSYARAVGADLHAIHAYLWRDREAVLLPTDLSTADTSGKHPRAVQPPEEISRLFAWCSPNRTGPLKCFAGDPGPVLGSQAEDADLLVVGTGDHVGRGRLLVGSVSHQCLTHAKCPVVAVPASQLIAKAGLNADPKAPPSERGPLMARESTIAWPVSYMQYAGGSKP